MINNATYVKDLTISQTGAALLAQREGLRTRAYRDIRGIWTIGVGHTAAAGEPYPCFGMEITKMEALELFQHNLLPYEAAVINALKREPTRDQFDAMVSLCYNIGEHGFAGSTVVHKFNEGDNQGAADAFLMWEHPPALRGRRESERRQFMGEEA